MSDFLLELLTVYNRWIADLRTACERASSSPTLNRALFTLISTQGARGKFGKKLSNEKFKSGTSQLLVASESKAKQATSITRGLAKLNPECDWIEKVVQHNHLTHDQSEWVITSPVPIPEILQKNWSLLTCGVNPDIAVVLESNNTVMDTLVSETETVVDVQPPEFSNMTMIQDVDRSLDAFPRMQGAPHFFFFCYMRPQAGRQAVPCAPQGAHVLRGEDLVSDWPAPPASWKEHECQKIRWEHPLKQRKWNLHTPNGPRCVSGHEFMIVVEEIAARIWECRDNREGMFIVLAEELSELQGVILRDPPPIIKKRGRPSKSSRPKSTERHFGLNQFDWYVVNSLTCRIFDCEDDFVKILIELIEELEKLLSLELVARSEQGEVEILTHISGPFPPCRWDDIRDRNWI